MLLDIPHGRDTDNLSECSVLWWDDLKTVNLKNCTTSNKYHYKRFNSLSPKILIKNKKIPGLKLFHINKKLVRRKIDDQAKVES